MYYDKPYIFRQPTIQAVIPKTAPMTEPAITLVPVSLRHITVNAIGITAGLRRTPLGYDQQAFRGKREPILTEHRITATYVLYVSACIIT